MEMEDWFVYGDERTFPRRIVKKFVWFGRFVDVTDENQTAVFKILETCYLEQWLYRDSWETEKLATEEEYLRYELGKV